MCNYYNNLLQCNRNVKETKHAENKLPQILESIQNGVCLSVKKKRLRFSEKENIRRKRKEYRNEYRIKLEL